MPLQQFLPNYMGAVSSPSTFLLWSILSCLFQVFLVVHLYYYDRFQCLKWSSGRQPGAFKRVMTYSYLATVPLLMVFSLSMTVMTYTEGYIFMPNGGVIPTPIMLWSKTSFDLLLPMMFVLAVAWSLELVTHLEELTFWLFMLHQGPYKRNWFQSWEFRVWYLGSMVAVLGMPIAVLIRRRVMETCLAWVFLSGSSAGLLTTLCFIYVLIKFPGFIHRVKAEGAEPDVVVRLATFYQLNIIRIIFRFLFNFPLLALALDGVQGPHNIVRTQAAADFLGMLGGIGCFVSSAITFLIFFPRSITRESGYRARSSSKQSVEKPPDFTTSQLPDYHRDPERSPASPPLARQSSIGVMNSFRFPNDTQHSRIHSGFYEGDDQDPYGGEATPQYESDPENVSEYPPPSRPDSVAASQVERKGDDSGSLNVHEMPEMHAGMEMQHQLSSESVKRSRRPRPRPPRQHEGRRFTPPDEKSKRPGMVVLPQLPRVEAISRDDPSSHSNASSKVIHPYVMTFTSPIDLLDDEEDVNIGRAL